MRSTRCLRRQRGVATLIVVMVLFFVVTMVAAYANRNMIFEQRTGANYYRATQAQEVAEAGLQWSLAMLNAGRIDAACAPSTAVTDNSFRDRYLSPDPGNGVIGVRTITPGGAPLTPTCVYDSVAGTWNCSCPVNGAAAPTVPASGLAPAYRVQFRGLGAGFVGRPGMVQVQVTACTRLANECLDFTADGLPNEGRAIVLAQLYHSGAAMAQPVAALTVRGSVTATGATVTNSNVGDTGITVSAGGSVAPGLLLNTLAGNALGGLGSVLPPDAALNPPDLPGSAPMPGRDRFVFSLVNMAPATLRNQPATLDLGTCGGGCDGATVAAAAVANPGRPIRVQGDLTIATTVEIGTAAEPVLLVIEDGSLDISAAGTIINGLVLVRRPAAAPDWSVPAQGLVNGAVVVDGNVVGSSSAFEIRYSGSLLRTLRARSGSYFTTPGGWRDAPPP